MKPAFPAARAPRPEDCSRALRIACCGLVLLGGLLAGFLSQASSPDYRHFSLVVLGFFAIPTLAVIFYFGAFRDKSRWAILAIHLPASLLVLEMLLRVWVGFRLV